MRNFHLKKSLNFSLDLWTEIFKEDYQIDSAHINRIKGYALAREALLELLKDQNIHLGPKDLKLRHYHSLLNVDHYTLSLGHTSLMGAAFLISKEKYRSVGIDLERNNRIVKDAIYNKMKHPQDEIIHPLQLWTLKEACFKALMNTEKFEKNIEFNSIQILANQTWLHSSGESGGWESFSEDDHMISLAWIKA